MRNDSHTAEVLCLLDEFLQLAEQIRSQRDSSTGESCDPAESAESEGISQALSECERGLRLLMAESY